FCANDEPVALIPKLAGGTFQAKDEKGHLLVDIIHDNQFHPKAVKLCDGETHKDITLAYTVTSSHGCINSVQQKVTIYALPDAGFQVGSHLQGLN
ncbi:hypothetical protein, partial [Aetokthonos hydrillicola]|uniref:hypothetical protein n=1 Tax=Aetokthonos hydrillicola TaxID=1550245 RepID=UPI001ABA5E11